MSISGDYAQPVTVNGFSCKNCTDVDYAKKHIDPAHPKDGPYGVNAKDKPGKEDAADKVSQGDDVRFGRGEDVRPALNDPATGNRLDVYA